MRKIQPWLKTAFVAAVLLLLGASVAAADIGPKPSVDIAVSLDGAPLSASVFYAQMLTCNAPDLQMSQQCGFNNPACDKFRELALPEPAESCTWRLQGPPTVWGGECKDSQCHFTYFLPERFRLAVYLPGHDPLFISNPVTRTALDSVYRLDLGGDGSARLVENTSLLRQSHAGGALAALLLSLVIELAAGYAYVRLTHSPRRALWGVLLGNLLTVPILWFLVSASFARGAFSLTLALSELGAVIVEGALIAGLTRGQMPPARAFSMSLLLNVVSFILGAPVLSVLTYLGLVQ